MAAPAPAPASASVPAAPPPTTSSEVRFAVVMYGGVSLAIYMNGITQELFSLVKSTQTDPRRDLETTATEDVYRKVAWLLANKTKRLQDWTADAATPRTQIRFVVDILSGTSAGGINAVFLAKALARGKGIESLMNLWIEEGDIAKLLNDKDSLKKKGVKNLPPQQSIESLLNGERLYREIYAALDEMDASASVEPVPKEPQLVDEVDLFVTTTDLEGILVPLQISDEVVFERNHRRVFHFQYVEPENGRTGPDDFPKENNAFLAFAARCTSSFPFAFQPMMLEDLRRFGVSEECLNRWANDFFKQYTPGDLPGRDDTPEVTPPRMRAFGDGGYLDNKPFGHAIDLLREKDAALPVVRKLVYVEPSPEHPEWERPEDGARPDVFQNVAAATFKLPGYETIRQDVERVLERNRIIEEVSRSLASIESDLDHRGEHRSRQIEQDMQQDEEKEAEIWSGKDLDQMLKEFGPLYGAYHRLRVLDLTDRYSQFLATAAGFNPQSHHVNAIRHIVQAWKDLEYVPYLDRKKRAAGGSGPAGENRFLYDFDLVWWLRRLKFVLAKADLLCGVEPDRRRGEPSTDADRRARELLEHGLKMKEEELWDPSGLRALKEQVAQLKAQLDKVFKVLRRKWRSLWKDSKPDLEALIRKTGITADELNRILQKQTDRERQEEVSKKMTPERKQALKDLGQALRQKVGEIVQEAVAGIHRVLPPHKGPEDRKAPTTALEKAQRSLGHFYYRFYYYDMVLFPVQYRTDLGEGGPVDIVRISPEDANSLRNGRKQKKLAGTALFNFGAFLDREWRRNDLLWGRLDGAERLIQSLFLGDPERAEDCRKLIAEAQDAILRERAKKDGVGFFHDLVKRADAEKDPRKYLLEQFGKEYKVPPDPDPEPMLHSAARGAVITGTMLEVVANKNDLGKGPAGYVLRLARIFWTLVEIATPRSIGKLLSEYLLQILGILGGLMAGISGLFGWTQSMVVGLILSGASLALLMILSALHSAMLKKPPTRVRVVLVVLAIVLLGFSAFGICGFFRSAAPWVRSHLGIAEAGEAKSPSK